MISSILIDLDCIAGLVALVGWNATVGSEPEISAEFPQNICFVSKQGSLLDHQKYLFHFIWHFIKISEIC